MQTIKTKKFPKPSKIYLDKLVEEIELFITTNNLNNLSDNDNFEIKINNLFYKIQFRNVMSDTTNVPCFEYKFIIKNEIFDECLNKTNKINMLVKNNNFIFIEKFYYYPHNHNKFRIHYVFKRCWFFNENDIPSCFKLKNKID